MTVVELDEDNTAIRQENFSSFVDGDSFEYQSSLFFDPSAVPTGIQLNVYGSNAAGDELSSFVAVSFTKDCSVYPVFPEGFALGWVQFVSVSSGNAYPFLFSRCKFRSQEIVNCNYSRVNSSRRSRVTAMPSMTCRHSPLRPPILHWRLQWLKTKQFLPQLSMKQRLNLPSVFFRLNLRPR